MDIAAEHKVYEFDDFRIDVAHLMLYHRGAEIPLVPKAVETLLALIERRGKIVSKDELLEAVWPDTVVEESNLFLYLSLLRKTLGTHKDGRPYVETLRRRGYRFSEEVHLVEEAVEDKNYELAVDEFERANIQSQSARVLVVKNWNRNTGESEKVSAASSALPALIPFESSHDLTPSKNELAPDELSKDLEVSERTLKQATRLVSDTGGSRRSKLRYVLAVSLVILLAAVFAGSFYWRSRHVVATKVDKPKAIAILPFRPLVDQNRDEALELGMADTLITRLGNNSAVMVRPLSSVRNFQGPDRDAINAGKALGVEAVLDCSIQRSIQRSGDRIRVNVRLINVADGTTLWAATFDKNFTDIFVVQDSIATSIANALALNLNSEERTRLVKRYTSNPDALEYYQRGRVNELKITKEGLNKAIEFYDLAIKADPNYALAYAHKADAYRVLGSRFASNNEVCPKVLGLAQRALEIDGSLAEAHLQIAGYDMQCLQDLTAAEAKFNQVIQMNPYDFQAHLGLAWVSLRTKRKEEAVAEARRARELSPMTPLVFALESQILLIAGHTDDAIVQAKKALDFEPNFWVAHLHLGTAYASQKHYDQATAEYEKAIQLAPETSGPKIALARLFIVRGDHKAANAILRELESHRNERFVSLSSIAEIYSALGDKERALDLLEKALKERDIRQNLSDDHVFDNLRSEPRFREILRRWNVPKYDSQDR